MLLHPQVPYATQPTARAAMANRATCPLSMASGGTRIHLATTGTTYVPTKHCSHIATTALLPRTLSRLLLLWRIQWAPRHALRRLGARGRLSRGALPDARIKGVRDDWRAAAPPDTRVPLYFAALSYGLYRVQLL